MRAQLHGYHGINPANLVSLNRGEMYFGIENEVMSSTSREDLLDELGNKDQTKFVCEQDGSIGLNGVEVISVPMKKNDAKAFVHHLLPLEKYQRSASCGLHIHMSKSALSMQQINRMLVFMNHRNNADFTTTIARRKSNHFCQRMTPQRVSASIRRGRTTTRYAVLNTQKPGTVEFRQFASTNTKEQMLADIDFAHAVAEYCKEDGRRLDSPKAFIAFVKEHATEYPDLVARIANASERFARFETTTEVVARTNRVSLNARIMPANGRGSNPTTAQVRNYVNTNGMPESNYSRRLYIRWYFEQCEGRFVTTQGNVLTGTELERRAVERLRCVRGN